MPDFTVYAIKGIPETARLLDESLRTGEGRFGWSYVETADLQSLRSRIGKSGWESLTADERDCYKPFLLDIKPGDHVVYINVPEKGKCSVAKVTGPYYWKWDDQRRDFAHRFAIDPSSIRIFNKNSDIVPPALRARLNLMVVGGAFT